MTPKRAILLFLTSLAMGCSSTHILVQSDPPDATAYLNGRPFGQTPAEADVRDGLFGTKLLRKKYRLSVKLDGFETHFDQIDSTTTTPYFAKLHAKLPKQKTSFEIYSDMAKSGDAVAQFILGMMYYRGEGIDKDERISFELFDESARQGFAKSLYMVGMCYKHAKGVVQSNSAAADWFYRASRQFLADGDRDLALASMDRILEMDTQHPLAAALKADMYSDNIVAKQRTAGDRIGTGFSVAPNGLVVTAYHVVKDAVRILAKFPGREPVEARILKSSESVDLALLRVESADLPWIGLAKSRSVAQGDRIYTFGYPAVSILGEDVKYADGTISSLTGLKGDATYMQVSIPIQPGNSGGPVLNEQGDAIGLVTSTASIDAFFHRTGSLPQNINWAVKIEAIEALLERRLSAQEKDGVNINRRAELNKQAVCMIIAKGARDQDGTNSSSK